MNKLIKNLILSLIILSSGLAFSSVSAQTPTEYQLLAPIPLQNLNTVDESTNTEEFIPGLVRLMIGISTALAVLVLIFAGIKYMSTDAFGGKEEAKSLISNALWGLFLAMGAWLILYTLNPKLVEFDLTIPVQEIEGALEGVGVPSVPGGSGNTSDLSLQNQQAYSALESGGVKFAYGTMMEGLKQKAIDEAINLKRSCGCEVYITSATGGTHAQGEFSHGNGYKIDLRLNSELNDYITKNYSPLPNRSDGARMYRAPSGALYAKEGNHWDVVASGS